MLDSHAIEHVNVNDLLDFTVDSQTFCQMRKFIPNFDSREDIRKALEMNLFPMNGQLYTPRFTPTEKMKNEDWLANISRADFDKLYHEFKAQKSISDRSSRSDSFAVNSSDFVSLSVIDHNEIEEKLMSFLSGEKSNIDLYELFVAVNKRGGLEELTRGSQWKDIANIFGFSDTEQMKELYRYKLEHFDTFCLYNLNSDDYRKTASDIFLRKALPAKRKFSSLLNCSERNLESLIFQDLMKKKSSADAQSDNGLMEKILNLDSKSSNIDIANLFSDLDFFFSQSQSQKETSDASDFLGYHKVLNSFNRPKSKDFTVENSGLRYETISLDNVHKYQDAIQKLESQYSNRTLEYYNSFGWSKDTSLNPEEIDTEDIGNLKKLCEKYTGLSQSQSKLNNGDKKRRTLSSRSSSTSSIGSTRRRRRNSRIDGETSTFEADQYPDSSMRFDISAQKNEPYLQRFCPEIESYEETIERERELENMLKKCEHLSPEDAANLPEDEEERELVKSIMIHEAKLNELKLRYQDCITEIQSLNEEERNLMKEKLKSLKPESLNGSRSLLSIRSTVFTDLNNDSQMGDSALFCAPAFQPSINGQ